MGSQNRKPRTLTIHFHATDEELGDIHGQLDVLIDRLFTTTWVSPAG